MQSLTEYLDTTRQDDNDQIDRLQDLIVDVVPTFIRLWEGPVKSKHDGCWPYQFKQGETTPKSAEPSASTHSMILVALRTLEKGHEQSQLVPAMGRRIKNSLPDSDKKALEDILGSAVKSLDNYVSTNGFVSGTFGDNDPLTLCWVCDLLVQGAVPSKSPSFIAKVKHAIETRLNSAVGDENKILEWSKSPKHSQAYRNAFLYQRINALHRYWSDRGVRTMVSGAAYNLPITPNSFERLVHEQLAYHKIKDSRFDSASLAFALEGALQIDPYTLKKATLRSIFDAMQATQLTGSQWRPNLPMFTTETGTVHFAVSVEIANSLIRSCHLLDNSRYPEYFVRAAPMFADYFEWLNSRVVRGTGKTTTGEEFTFVGWHSEHVNQDGLIHLWETSQVLIFLRQYASAIKNKSLLKELRQHDCRDGIIVGWKFYQITGTTSR
jgi:hypothetical protein